MQGFKSISGIACLLLSENIDTDVIMPKQFLKGIDRSDLDKGLFYDLRFKTDGSLNSDFILNQPYVRGVQILVVGPNFGCGSSREHAVWGLKQYGIKVLIGTTFAGIFNDNCLRNGILTISLPSHFLIILSALIMKSHGEIITINLEDQSISLCEHDFSFNIEPLKKEMLLKGLDAIGVTLSFAKDIVEFESEYFIDNPWSEI